MNVQKVKFSAFFSCSFSVTVHVWLPATKRRSTRLACSIIPYTMIKILTPAELVLNYVDKNEFCRDFILKINETLSEVENPFKQYYTVSLGVEEEMDTKDKESIETVFRLFGWDVVITANGKQIVDDEEAFLYNVILTRSNIGKKN